MPGCNSGCPLAFGADGAQAFKMAEKRPEKRRAATKSMPPAWTAANCDAAPLEGDACARARCCRAAGDDGLALAAPLQAFGLAASLEEALAETLAAAAALASACFCLHPDSAGAGSGSSVASALGIVGRWGSFAKVPTPRHTAWQAVSQSDSLRIMDIYWMMCVLKGGPPFSLTSN
eukprot:COSAG05_NODE_2151_length_3472_cov_160.289835_1_plen_176_part_00